MGLVHIELSDHVSGLFEENQQLKKLEAGDTSASFWPEVVTTRMTGYMPDVVISDSLTYSDAYDENGPPDIREAEKTGVLYFCPPSYAQKSGKDVLLVGGDCLMLNELVESPPLMARIAAVLACGYLGGATTAEVIHHLDKIQARQESKQVQAKQTGVIPIDPLLRLRTSNETTLEPKVYTRRKALSSSLVTLGVLTGVIALVGPTVVAEADNHNEDIVLKASNLFNFLRPSTYSTWIDGRTAIMIEKAVHYSREYDTNTAVVMGNGHFARCNEFLNNRDARLNAIFRFGRTMIEIANSASDVLTGTDLAERIDYLDKQISGAALFTVSPDVQTDSHVRLHPSAALLHSLSFLRCEDIPSTRDAFDKARASFTALAK